ncbi:hypothetical protein [Cylindrospermopsis curvispora]|uniref:Uncharacterized protein n=1 Tax=Cylindrospermopsis curvispora GIHE-G1 TaxID=2666332 RepID=A0A7H0F5S8_9CYAN|nr:hypothetical protein [Cylindrospermopsis curvispora]QNP31394.1 hypothetical protein IAR63_17510 [Cylindrospermopsis curvispora GIHE-G1]
MLRIIPIHQTPEPSQGKFLNVLWAIAFPVHLPPESSQGKFLNGVMSDRTAQSLIY